MGLWRIECFNHTIWEAPKLMYLADAITLFKKVTELGEMDIITIRNLH